MKVDKLMTEVDHGARSSYEERVAQAEPEAGTGSGTGEKTEPAAQREVA